MTIYKMGTRATWETSGRGGLSGLEAGVSLTHWLQDKQGPYPQTAVPRKLWPWQEETGTQEEVGVLKAVRRLQPFFHKHDRYVARSTSPGTPKFHQLYNWFHQFEPGMPRFPFQRTWLSNTNQEVQSNTQWHLLTEKTQRPSPWVTCVTVSPETPTLYFHIPFLWGKATILYFHILTNTINYTIVTLSFGASSLTGWPHSCWPLTR